MITCQCGGKTRVAETRDGEMGVWRRRECLICKTTFATMERITVTESPTKVPTKRILPVRVAKVKASKAKDKCASERAPPSARNRMEDAKAQRELERGS